jgi:hypothetical protein
MDRELQYRGKRSYGTRWYYGYYSRELTDEGEFDFIGHREGAEYVRTIVDDRSVGQYIGLTDKIRVSF